MTNLERYNRILKKILQVTDDQLNSDLKYQGIPTWDSVGHMEMVAELEEAFDIMLETIDVFDFNTYDKGITILRDKYGVDM